MRGKSRDRLADAALFAALALCVAAVRCPFRWFTGVSCPGCGMTRAVLALLRLDVRGAVAYHPLSPLLPAAAAVWLLRRRVSPQWLRGLALMGLSLMLAVYLLRMARGSEIVYFRPETGAAFRLLRTLRGT